MSPSDSVELGSPKVIFQPGTEQPIKDRPTAPGPSTTKASDDMCFAEAVKEFKQRRISEDEYLYVIIGHATGRRHGRNRLCNGDTELSLKKEWRLGSNFPRKKDKFAAALIDWLSDDVINREPVNDVIPIIQVVKAYRHADESGFDDGFVNMREAYDTHITGWRRHNKDDYLSNSLIRKLAYFTLKENNAAMMKIICSDADRLNYLQQNLDFQQIFAGWRTGLEKSWVPPWKPEVREAAIGAGFRSNFPNGCLPNSESGLF